MRFEQNILLALVPSLASAWSPPSRDGFEITWSDAFKGKAGSKPDSKWNIMDAAIQTNNEVQAYVGGSDNLQISGGETIQFVPRKLANGDWTSARIETQAAFTPQPGGKMIMEASILIGTNAVEDKQGIWPAFWSMGDALRSQHSGWPMSGEIDIFELPSGSTAHGTVHCGEVLEGGPCHETTGLGSPTAMPLDGQFHTWNVVIDRTNSDWTQQTITWNLDGKAFKTLPGSEVGDAGAWATLAHSPYYMILNVAVGGDWPGPPDADTMDGYGSMMEVAYVAVYQSK